MKWFGINSIDRSTVWIAWSFVASRKHTALWLVTGSIVAAVLEGGSIGLLLIIASAALDKNASDLGQLLGQIGMALPEQWLAYESNKVVFIAILLVVFVQLLKITLVFVVKVGSIELQRKIQDEVQGQLIRTILKTSYESIAKLPPGKLSAYLALSGGFSTLINLGVNVVAASLMSIAYLVSMVLISPSLTGFLLLLAAVGSLGFSVLIREVGQQEKTYAEELASRESVSIEIFSHPRTIRILQAEKYAEKLIGLKRKMVLDASRLKQVLTARIPLIIEAATIGLAGALLAGAYLLMTKNVLSEIGPIIVFLIILNRLVPQLRTFTQLRAGLAGALNGTRYVTRFINEHKEPVAQINQLKVTGGLQKIAFQKVTFGYPESSSSALTEIDLEILRNSTVAIVGPSGSGKTTLTQLLLKLFAPTSGQILVNNNDLSNIDSATWLKKVAIVDGKSALFDLTVKENISFPDMNADPQEVRDAARRANIDSYIKSLDKGYETVLGSMGYTVSAGQKQRILLARALFRRPELLILDEATNSLDPESEDAIQETLGSISGVCAILIIAHNPRAIRTAREVYFIENGKVRESGLLESLILQDGPVGKWWRDDSL